MSPDSNHQPQIELLRSWSFDHFFSAVERSEELMSRMSLGDILLLPVVKCLEDIAFLYGEQFILLQYIPSITHVVSWANANHVPYRTKTFIGIEARKIRACQNH